MMLLVAGLSRRLLAQVRPPLRFRPLAQPVLVPLDDLATQGRAHPFVAQGMMLPSAATPNQPIRISGMVVRIAGGGNQPAQFKAVCVRCPHEGCDVDFMADPARLPTEVVDEIGHPMTQPVYLCPCHNSTFTMDEGERLSGPAPRGLYRFNVTRVTDAAVEIAEVEEDVLIFG
jgi:Rieske Fe-S protein